MKIFVVFQLAVLIIIPIILPIIMISPFEVPVLEEEETVQVPASDGTYTVFFILSVIWLLMLLRVLYQLKKRTFKIRTRL